MKALQNVPDDNFDYPLIDVSKKLPLQPIRYGIELSSDRVDKTGSFIANLFLGQFDRDFLKYPSVLYSRKEFMIVREQYEMVKQHFNKIFSEPNSQATLNKLGFQNLWLLSRTEMIHLFEAVGASFGKPYQVNSTDSVRIHSRSL
jgi:hypothetical protein